MKRGIALFAPPEDGMQSMLEYASMKPYSASLAKLPWCK